MPFVEGGIVVDAEQPQQQAAPQAAQGGFVEGGITVDPTPDDSYNMVLQYNAAQTDYVPSKQDFLDYLKVSKTKPLLGEKPLETIGTAAVQTVEDIASMPYKLGEAIGQYMDPPEGVTPMQLAGGTAAEIAVQSRLKAENMGRGLIDTALNKLSDITGKLRNDDDKYEAFLAAAEIKRQLARANAPGDQRVPASQDVLQAYGIPQEAISQEGLDVGGFLADPSSIAFAGGGKLASALAQRAIPLIPRAGQILQRAGERISNLGRGPENIAGRFTTKVTGSEQMGQAVQEGIAKGTTGITLGEAAGLPLTMNVPGLGTVAKTITATKGLGGAMETVGEAGTVSGGPSLTATQRGLLGAGERIAAAEGASSRARALGTALARSGLETPVRGAATILLPMAGAGVAGGALAALTGEEGDAVAAAIGSGAGFGVFDGGFTLAKAVQANAFNGGRVRQTAVDDLNTRPTDVQFTYIDPVAGEQTATIKDSEARATLYGRLNNKQLTKVLSEVAAAEGAGVDVIFHSDADTVPAGLQTVNYAGAAIGPENIKSGKSTILINVDKAIPETIPHEILHARITKEIVNRLGSQVINAAIETPQGPSEFKKQFVDFAEKYAKQIEKSGGKILSDEILTELRDAFDPTLQRAQNIKAIGRITDEFAAYYTQEMLKGKDPKTMLPGRIPSFIEMALNNAKEAVSERFTRRALQAGFDPVARTFYDANGRRIKLDWMEDAIKNLVTPKEGYEPTEQRVDINKMTQAQQNAVIMARGYSDLFMTAPDGSIVRPLSKAELAAKTADIANRTMRVVESVPQAERTSISGMDAYGNPVIEGRLSLAEADAVSKSGIFGPSSSRTLIDIATAIRDGTLMEGNYWKVYGSTGRSGVFGESQKLFLPYGISINSKGGVNVKVVDWGKVQARMYKALTKPAYKSLFNNYDQAMSTMRDVYLKNIAETGAVPSAEALGGGIDGAKKRNMFNEIMGAVPKKGDVMVNFPTAGYVANRKGGSVYQDLRLERIQNADSTKAQIPWTGDMGEQSSYRRTQLNFMPAEAIGETRVSTDENGGYRILSKNGKFRLYGPDGSTVGIFDTQEQAKLKAEKDYATQTRLQPEVRQQQRQAGDEGRQATEAGGRNRTERGQEGQGEGGAVRQAGDVIQNFDALVAAAPDVRFMPVESQPENAPVAGRILEGQRKSIDELSEYYAAKTPERAKVLKSDAIDSLSSRLINKGVPVQEANAIASKTFSKLRKGVSGAMQVISGMGLSDLSRMAGTGKPTVERRSHVNQNWLTSAFEAFATDEGLALMKAQQVATQLNKADQAKAAAGESVEAARASGVRQSTMQQGMEFVLGEINADRKAFGTSLREDLNSPPRVYASVGEGQKFGGQGNYNVFFEWKKETPMVATSHHHYGVANGVTGIHAQGNIGDKNARSFGNPSAEKYDTLPSGKQVLDTHLLVGNQGVPDARAHQLTVSIPDSSLSGIRKVYKDKGAAGVEAELNRIAVNQMVGTKSQGKTQSFTSKEGIPPVVAIQKNRTEAYVMDPDLANVASVTIVSNSPKEVALIRKNLESAFAKNGSALPKVKVVSAESGASGNVGRKAITDEYFKLTGEQRYMPASDTDYLSAVKKGDTATAQQMVDEAAKAAGYTTKVFHGTISQFNKPNTPLFLGDEGTAMSYAQDRAMGYGEGANPVTYKIYAKFKNTASESDVKQAATDLGLEVENDMAYTALDPKISGSKYVSRVISELKKRGYDSANIDDFSPDNAQEVIKSFVAFDPSQLKLADPITKDNAGNVIPLSQRFKATSEDIRFMPDYSGEHKAPQRDYGAPLDNLKGVYPDDVYGPNAAQYYGHSSGDATDKAAARIIQATKGKPDAPVKVFRAIPKSIQSNEINPGDWITTIKSYAVDHGEGPLGGDYKILEKTVPAGDLYTNGDSIFEFGYDPKFMPSPDSAMPGAYSFPGGYRAIPGKAKGSLRLYGPAGSLIGIASSLDEAQRILRRKGNR
jgi:hypothetical protein